MYTKNNTGFFASLSGKKDTSLIIPDSVTDIGDSVFFCRISLERVIIGRGITKIGRNAFKSAVLTCVIIPDSVTSIGDSAFYNCTNLTCVKFDGTIPSANFSFYSPFPGDLRAKYLAGGIGTYTRPDCTSTEWTKQ